MKVLYLSKALVVGSYQTKSEALAALPDIELTVAVPPSWRDERGETPLERAHLKGYRLDVVPIRFNGNFHTHYYPTLGGLLDQLRPDLFHIDEEAYNFATFDAGWLAHRRRIPFLFFTWQNLARRYPFPFRLMERWVYAHAAHAIAGNREAAAVLTGKGFEKTIDVIPQFGVDPRLFPPRTEATDDEPRCIGYAGRFVPEKGLAVLLTALGQLKALKWRLTLRGSGPQAAELRQLATQQAIADRVEILPPLPSTQMVDFYRACDIFVLPSLTQRNWKEQFGRVLIEAMASRVAVVGSDSGEIPHVIGDAGLVTPEGDSDALSAALRRLLTDETLRQTLADAGRQRVLQRFTQAAIAARTASVYRRVGGRGV